jgi:hypothetical protein
MSEWQKLANCGGYKEKQPWSIEISRVTMDRLLAPWFISARGDSLIHHRPLLK